MHIQEAIHWGRKELESSSLSPGLDAERFLEEILKCDLAFLLAHGEERLTLKQEKDYKESLERRKKGEPVAYILGKTEFYGLEFQVDERVLVPRPDTEILVEMVLKHLDLYLGFHPDYFLVDVGTGSGCIPLSILHHASGGEAIGLEISKEALEVAEKNTKKLALEDRFFLAQSDLLQYLPHDKIQAKKWILTANLPYLPQHWPKHASTTFEPSLALFGGEKGIEGYRQLARQIESLEHKPQALFFEGFTFQAEDIQSFLPSYQAVELRKMTGESCGIHFNLKQDFTAPSF